MRSSTIRLLAVFGLLLMLAASSHWIGPGPDGTPSSHRAPTVAVSH
jgi:hypothetical protein